MSEGKICPVCGLPQQWEMWTRCACGYDFGPPGLSEKLEQKREFKKLRRNRPPITHKQLVITGTVTVIVWALGFVFWDRTPFTLRPLIFLAWSFSGQWFIENWRRRRV
jgi:hypothetical protein